MMYRMTLILKKDGELITYDTIRGITFGYKCIWIMRDYGYCSKEEMIDTKELDIVSVVISEDK